MGNLFTIKRLNNLKNMYRNYAVANIFFHHVSHYNWTLNNIVRSLTLQ